MALKIKIPEKDKGKVSKLIKLSEPELIKLYEALKGSKPQLKIQSFIKEIQNIVSIDKDIILLIMNFYWIRVHYDLLGSDLAEQLCATLKESEDADFGIPEIGWSNFQQHLVKMLSLDESVLVTAKSIFIAFQLPCYLEKARIYTDTRPVFGADVSKEPNAFIIYHTIQIDIKENDESRELFISLNSKDFMELKDSIDRAFNKEASLRNFLIKTNACILEWEKD